MKANKPKTRKGRCVNFGNCSMADDGIVQEIASNEDFVCKNRGCGHELEEVQTQKSKRWIWVIVGLVVIIAVMLIFVRGCGGHKKSVDVIDTTFNDCGDTIIVKGMDTTIRKNKTIVTVIEENGDTVVKKGCDEIERRRYRSVKSHNDKPDIRRKVVSLNYGDYYGPTNSYGEPHGSGGRVVITVEYNGWKNRKIEPGDEIKNTTFDNGELLKGRLIKKNGDTYNI